MTLLLLVMPRGSINRLRITRSRRTSGRPFPVGRLFSCSAIALVARD